MSWRSVLVRWLGAVLAVVVLALLGGGWYFAGQLYDDGLKVRPSFVPRDLSVTAVTRTSITLKGSADELRTSGTYGVQWRTGFGQVTTVLRRGDEVTRSFRLLTGSLPAVGDVAGLTPRAFPDDPGEGGL